MRINERIEFDCDPIGQSPVDVVWFMRPQIASIASRPHNNISSSSTLSMSHQLSHQISRDSYENQMMTNNSSASSSFEHHQKTVQTNTGENLGRRLYMATIRTEFSHRDQKYSSTSIALQSNSGGVSQQNLHLESYIRSQNPSLIMSEHVLDEMTPFLSEPYISFELMRRQTDSEFLKLIIKQAKRQHSTDFICKATNRFGSDEKLIKLLVQEAPDPVQEITLVQVGSRSLSITWMPPYNGNSPITSYTVEWAPINNQLFSNNFSFSPTIPLPSHKTPLINISPTSPTPQATSSNSTAGLNNNNNNVLHLKWSHSMTLQPAFTMSSLQPLTSYEIRIRAHNLFGQSSSPSNRLPIIVTTTEEAPTTPPSDIRVVPLSSSSIQITWLPPTQDVIQNSNSLSSPIEELKFDGPKYSIKGYYLGYKLANSNESFVYKTVSLSSQPSNDHGIIVAQQEISTTTSQQSINNSTFPNNKKSLTTTNNDSRRLKVVIDDLKRSAKYSISVQAFNSAGPGPQSDQIEVKTLANDPPPAPLLRVGIVTYTSIELQWSFQLDLVNKFEANLIDNSTDRFKVIDPSHLEKQQQQHLKQQQQQTDDNKHLSKNAPIEGYLLYYRQLDGQWIERKLTPATHTMIASNHQRNDMSIIELSSNSLDLLNVNNAVTSMPTSMETTSAATATTSMPAITNNEAVTTTSSSSHSSLQIGWHKNTSLAYKSFRFILNQLSCGTPYQLYLVAYNSIGSGLRSQVIRTKTRGLAPIAPRKQDYITLNSTYVQLNFDAWMDGGCSIGNFEIRYKQLYSSGSRSGGGGPHQSEIGSHLSQSRAPTSPYPASILNENNSSSGSNQQQWLLLSNNISPEQRMIELRDLQPETWYSILTTAESAAGKTEVQHSFMTLDKFGQLPAEAVESASNLPALFRNNASIRSILHNFTTSGNNMSSSSLIMSACLALILFATCSLFLIRRYNNTMKDSVSMDSQTTSAVLGSSTSQFHHNNTANKRNHQHRQQTTSQQHTTGGGYSNILHLDDSNSFDAHNNNGKHSNNNHYSQTAYGLAREHYSLKDSPCKTTTATIITGSSTNDSSGIMTGSSLCNDELATNNSHYAPTEQTNTATIDLNRFMMDHNEDNCIRHTQYAHNTALPSANQDVLDDFCSASCTSTSINSPDKFSTMVRNDNNSIEHHGIVPQLQTSRFKTMPHQRPVSSFIPNGSYQNTGRCYYNTNNQQQQQQRQNLLNNDQQHQQQQHQLNNEQQIYSKLKLIYNSHSNYNICPEGQKGISVELPSHLYNPDASNMSMLATQQQNQQKMLGCSLKGGNQPQQLGMYLSNGFNNQIPESDPNELTSLLLECQHQHHQQQQIVDSNEGYTQCQVGQQQIHLSDQQVVDQSTTDYLMACSVPPASSSSNSASNSTSTQQTSSSSMSSNGNNNNNCGSSSEQHQLINMTNGNNNLNIPVGQQCSKMTSNQMKVATNQQQQNVPSQSQQQQLQQQQTNQPTSNEQSDYALPFPPKWV